MLRALPILALVACRQSSPDEVVCRCTPANSSLTRRAGAVAPMDGVALLAELRRHQQAVRDGKNARSVKLVDDELRLALTDFCHPCSDWVTDRLTIDEMFPLGRLDEATTGVCMGLVLRDGTTAWGDARPRACR